MSHLRTSTELFIRPVVYCDREREPIVLRACRAPGTVSELKVLLHRRIRRWPCVLSYWNYASRRYELLLDTAQLRQPQAIFTPKQSNASTHQDLANDNSNSVDNNDSSNKSSDEPVVYRCNLWLETTLLTLEAVSSEADNREFVALQRHVSQCSAKSSSPLELVGAARVRHNYLTRMFDSVQQSLAAESNTASEAMLMFYANNSWSIRDVLQRGFDLCKSTSASFTPVQDRVNAATEAGMTVEEDGWQLLHDNRGTPAQLQNSLQRSFMFTSCVSSPPRWCTGMMGSGDSNCAADSAHALRQVLLCEVAPGRVWKSYVPLDCNVAKCGALTSAPAASIPFSFDSVMYETNLTADVGDGKASDSSGDNSGMYHNNHSDWEDVTRGYDLMNRGAAAAVSVSRNNEHCTQSGHARRLRQIRVGVSHQALSRYLLTLAPHLVQPIPRAMRCTGHALTAQTIDHHHPQEYIYPNDSRNHAKTNSTRHAIGSSDNNPMEEENGNDLVDLRHAASSFSAEATQSILFPPPQQQLRPHRLLGRARGVVTIRSPTIDGSSTDAHVLPDVQTSLQMSPRHKDQQQQQSHHREDEEQRNDATNRGILNCSTRHDKNGRSRKGDGDTRAQRASSSLSIVSSSTSSTETAAASAATHDAVQRKQLQCSQHGGQITSLYCTNCDDLVCPYCASIGEHRRHDVCTAHDAASLLATRVRHMCNALATAVQMIAQARLELTEEAKELRQRMRGHLTLVHRRFGQLHRALHRSESALVNELRCHDPEMSCDNRHGSNRRDSSSSSRRSRRSRSRNSNSHSSRSNGHDGADGNYGDSNTRSTTLTSYSGCTRRTRDAVSPTRAAGTETIRALPALMDEIRRTQHDYSALLRPLEDVMQQYGAVEAHSGKVANSASAGVGTAHEGGTLVFVKCAPVLLARAQQFLLQQEHEHDQALRGRKTTSQQKKGESEYGNEDSGDTSRSSTGVHALQVKVHDILVRLRQSEAYVRQRAERLDLTDLRQRIGVLHDEQSSSLLLPRAGHNVSAAPSLPTQCREGVVQTTTASSAKTIHEGRNEATAVVVSTEKEDRRIRRLERCVLDLQRGYIWTIERASYFFSPSQRRTVTSTPFRLLGVEWELKIAASTINATVMIAAVPSAAAEAEAKPQASAPRTSSANCISQTELQQASPRTEFASTAKGGVAYENATSDRAVRSSVAGAPSPNTDEEWLGIFLCPRDHALRMDFRVIAFSEVIRMEWTARGWRDASGGKGWGVFPFLRRCDLMRTDKLARDDMVKICVTPITGLY